MLVFALASGVTPALDAGSQVPVLLALLAALVIGLAMLLSALYVRYRDVKPIWEVMLQVLFYATPVIYAIETIDVARADHARRSCSTRWRRSSSSSATR